MALKGGGGQAGAIKAGAAYVSIEADDTALQRGIQAARRRLQSFGASLRTTGLGIFGAGAGLLAPVAGVFKGMLDSFGDVQDAADRLGTTTEAFSKLSYAADQSGASVEDLETAAKQLQKAIGTNVCR